MTGTPQSSSRWATCENATAQIAHLVFADTQKSNPKKPKELFFASARTKGKFANK
jgi:hypothetical protein